jgi:hypothetical protein
MEESAVGMWPKMESSLSVYVLALELLSISSSYRITTVIMRYFLRVNMLTRRIPMVQVCFFVGISSIYHCTAFDELTLDVDNGVGKSWSSSFHFLRVCVGKGFEHELSDNSDLSFSVRRVFLL